MNARKPTAYVPRFAGEAFTSRGALPDGQYLRRLVSEVAWKRPPSADVKAQVST